MRRWLTIAFVVLAAGAAGVILLPWWLGAVLRPLARAHGIEIGAYERAGYARFRLHDLRFENPGVLVTARLVEADTPLLWLCRVVRSARSPVDVQGWEVKIQDQSGESSPDSSASIDGVPALQVELNGIVRVLARWVDQAHLGSGAIQWPGGKLTLAQVDWRDSKLAARGLLVAGRAFDVSVLPGSAWRIALRSADPAEDWSAEAAWNGADIDGAVSVWSQPARFHAHFADRGWLPVEASADTGPWDMPASRAKLDDRYERLQGSGRLVWKDRAFGLSLQAKAVPKKGVAAPPLAAQAEVRGDLHALTIASLRVNAPFAAAELTAPVTLGFDGSRWSGPARLTIGADLAGQPWVKAHGKVHGSIIVPEAVAGRQEFQLGLEDVQVGGFSVRRVAIQGALQWPRLVIASGEAETDEGSRVTVRGACDLRKGELDGVTLQGAVGSAWLAPWLPPGVGWAKAEIDARVSGPLLAPAHEGSLKMTGARVAPLNPFNLAATWKGHGAVLGELTVRAEAGTATLRVVGSADARGAVLRELQLTSRDGGTWNLVDPATVTWAAGAEAAGIRLAGSGNGAISLAATGGSAGSFRIDATNAGPELWRDWLPMRGPAWRLQQLHADGRVADGKLVFAADLAGEIKLGSQFAAVRLAVSGDDRGVRLADLQVAEGERMLAHAAGRIPIVWDARTVPHLQIDTGAPVEFEADTAPDQSLWAAVAEATGISFTDPSARLRVGGTLLRPQGELHIETGRVAAVPGRFGRPLPEVDGLKLDLRVERDQIALDNLTAQIEGQTVRAAARLPMTNSRWNELWREPGKFEWSAAVGHVEIPDIDLALLARRVPGIPVVAGRLRAEASLAPGGRLTGELRLTGAVARPLEPLGVVQAINADLAFAGRTVEVRSLSAQLGGEPVTVEGRVTWPTQGPPQVALAMRGTNLPLVRRAGLLVRTDFNLRADTDSAGVTRLTGAVDLRDCLVLADFHALFPTGGQSVAQRPPYFAVGTPPFDRWQLAVDVRGPRKVRMRTTVFTGIASPRFHLAGTLGEPRAVGEVDVDEGQVLFPFATFTVQFGVLRLPEADPYHPKIALTAVSNRQDYQLRMEASGSPESPNLQFSSIPPLEPAQVLLLVTAGQASRNETAGAGTNDQRRLTRLGAYLGKGFFSGLGGGDENRLEITSGDQVSQMGRETYDVEYKLNDRWSLVGEYDQFDYYNAGLKWRVYRGEGGANERK